MGVTKLFDFFRKKCPQVLRPARDLDHAMRLVREMGCAAENAVAVDVSVLMHKIIHGRSTRAGAGVEEVAQQFVKYANYFTSGGRHAYFVFDGEPAELKANHEKVKREERRERTKEKISDVSDRRLAIEHAVATSATAEEKAELRRELALVRHEEKRLQTQILRPTRHHFDRVWQALKGLSGVTVCQAHDDGEAGCAALARAGKVALCISTDADLLPYGSPFSLLEFESAKDRMGSVICLEEVHRALEMDRDMFVEFCILCGCDFTPKLPGIGNVKAESLIKKHGTIQAFLSSSAASKFSPEDVDGFLWREAKDLFMNPAMPDAERHIVDRGHVVKQPSIVLEGVLDAHSAGSARIPAEAMQVIRESVRLGLAEGGDAQGEAEREQEESGADEAPSAPQDDAGEGRGEEEGKATDGNTHPTAEAEGGRAGDEVWKIQGEDDAHLNEGRDEPPSAPQGNADERKDEEEVVEDEPPSAPQGNAEEGGREDGAEDAPPMAAEAREEEETSGEAGTMDEEEETHAVSRDVVATTCCSTAEPSVPAATVVTHSSLYASLLSQASSTPQRTASSKRRGASGLYASLLPQTKRARGSHE